MKELKYHQMVWILLIGAPILLFVLSSLYAGTYVFLHRGETANLGTVVSNAIPYILLVNYAILLLITLFAMKKSHLSFSMLGLTDANKNTLKQEILFGIVLGTLLVLALQLLMKYIIFPQGSESMFQPGEGFPIIIYSITAIVVAPLVEELLYRGYAITVLKEKFGINLAIFLSAFFFSFLHFGEGLPGLLTAFIVGLIFGITFFLRKNIIHLIFAHALFNLISIIVF